MAKWNIVSSKRIIIVKYLIVLFTLIIKLFMKKIKLLTLSVLLLAVVLGSAFSPRFATTYFTYSGTNEFNPANYTTAAAQAPIPGPNNQLAWIEVDDTEIYPAGHTYQFKPMVDIISAIRSALLQALSFPKIDIRISIPITIKIELKP